jgi:DNA-binding LytR/AlgR family response regulator
MNQVHCLIIDDEPPARLVLETYLAATPMLKWVGSCENALQAYPILLQQPVDLLFIDISMPVLTGIDFVKSLPSAPEVIFTTAFREYAWEGFELNACDYLLKPFSFERFLKAIQKSKSFQLLNTSSHSSHSRNSESLPALLPPTSTPSSKPDGLASAHSSLHTSAHSSNAQASNAQASAFIYVRVDRKMVKVILADILFVESIRDYVKIVTPQQEWLVRQSLSSMEELLPEQDFVRIHRSYIIGKNHVLSYSHDLLQLKDYELPIGRMYRQDLGKKL